MCFCKLILQASARAFQQQMLNPLERHSALATFRATGVRVQLQGNKPTAAPKQSLVTSGPSLNSTDRGEQRSQVKRATGARANLPRTFASDPYSLKPIPQAILVTRGSSDISALQQAKLSED